jgi:threonine dehydrogenase-like Zn-dependent dehydrogenase
MGHEFVGELVACGPQVTRFRPGDRVVSPFTTGCGGCFYCQTGLSARCIRGQLFGWVERGKGLQGGQAELVRVPLAEHTLMALPSQLESEVALLLGDVLATGYHAARLAGLTPGADCAVVGCGPVGLMAILAARELGAERVFAFDRVAERLALAQRLGAEPVDLDAALALERVHEATEGRGVGAVLEAVGSAEAGALAFTLVRPGGTIAVVGVHHEQSLPFTPGQAYDKNLTYRIGRCPARSYGEVLLPIALRRAPELRMLFTHRVGLDAVPDAYRTFAERRDGCIKVAIRPRG